MKLFMGIFLLLPVLIFSEETPTVIVNPSPFRPLFNLETDQSASSRTLAPSSRIQLSGSLRFSGLGLKHETLGPDTYYFADFHGRRSLFRLSPDQILLMNSSGKEVTITISGKTVLAGELVSGNFALAEKSGDGTLTLELSDSQGNKNTQNLVPGKVYRLELKTDELGTTNPIATIWD